MSPATTKEDNIQISGAPAIDGLRFRYYRGLSEIPAMLAVMEGSKVVDGFEEVGTVEGMAHNYANLKNCEPEHDVVIVEVSGKVVGYKRVAWWAENEGPLYYDHFGFLLPEWRGKGIGRALVHHSEARIREIAAGHDASRPKYFNTYASDKQTNLTSLLIEEGYSGVRYKYSMVRPDLENIPEVPMPEGLELRPVRPEHYRAIWEAEVDAFKDHWGAATVDEVDYKRWLLDPNFQPELWTVAWDGDRVAGTIRNFINSAENARFGRARGYTENITVGRPWRRRGLARAMLARSFAIHKREGMTQATLNVDAENPSGALQLYRSMGFEPYLTNVTYRKAL